MRRGLLKTQSGWYREKTFFVPIGMRGVYFFIYFVNTEVKGTSDYLCELVQLKLNIESSVA